MGLFSPKINPREFQYVQSRLSQLQDAITLVNTTTKPDVFFKRLHMSLDILLELQAYEKYGIFKGSKPSEDYSRILSNLNATVNDFIDRALAENWQKVTTLKTESAKQNNRTKFLTSLISAFDCANTFWSGSFSQTKVFPHYTGPLFTANNYQRLSSLLNTCHPCIAYCSACGAQIGIGDRFCSKCGRAVSTQHH